MKYLVILFLFLCEFTFGQIPGFPKFVGTRNFPTVYTLSYTILGDASSADVTAQVINTGSLINETGSPTPTTLVSGILWGNAPPTITDGVSRKTTDGRIDGQPFTTTISQFPEEGTIYIVAYATTAAGTFYGKVLTITQDVVRSPYTNKLWMDRNLGATSLPQSATAPSSQDSTSMGGLYQWGRKSDGHQIVLPRSGSTFFSGTTSARQSSSSVVSDKFYTHSGGSPLSDWLTATKNTLWQGLNGENNPCPTGFRVPTVTEFTNETNNFTQTMNGAFISFLRLPATGYRNFDGTQASYIGYNQGRYWTSSVSGTTQSSYLLFNSGGISASGIGRILGQAVRCIKGEATSGGSAVISQYTEGSSTGYLKIGEPASGFTKTMFANVTTAGSYYIKTLPINNNGVVFSASGTFTSTGNNKSITLTATGTPNSQGTNGSWTYYSNTEPQFGFNVTIVGESSTNGTAIVSDYTFVSSQEELHSPEDPTLSNVTQTIRANVTKTGTYFLSTSTINGTTFSANGTFTTLGNNDITLVATGTPISTGTYTFTLNTTPGNNFNRQVYLLQDPSTNGKAIVSGYTFVSSQGELHSPENPTLSNVTQTIRANVTKTGTYNLSTTTINGTTFSANGNFATLGNNDITLVATGTPISTGTYTFTLNTTPGNNFNRQVYLLQDPSTNGKAIVSGYTFVSSQGELHSPEDPTLSNVTQTIRANVTKTGTYNLSTTTINGTTFSANGNFATLGNNDITLVATGTPISTGTYTFTLNTTPSNNFNRQVYLLQDPSTNGKAIVSGYTSISSGGTMYRSSPVSNVTQTIRANVTKTGTYNLSTSTNNGITFSANGTFGSTGNKDITLTATGTPISAGNYSFTTNTNPSLSFNGESVQPSTGGQAVVTDYSIGQNILDQTPGTKQTIIANVATAGTYSITTNTISGARFTGSGTFTNTGSQTITLTLTPTPKNYDGVYTFSLNTTPSATFSITKNASSGGSAIITWDGVDQSSLTTEQRAENNRKIVRETEASTYSPPFIHYFVVNVTQIGTYNIESYGNRTSEGNTLRLVGSGTFTTTGVQTIPLYFYGVARNYSGNAVNHYFYLPNDGYGIVYYFIKYSQ